MKDNTKDECNMKAITSGTQGYDGILADKGFHKMCELMTIITMVAIKGACNAMNAANALLSLFMSGVNNVPENIWGEMLKSVHMSTLNDKNDPEVAKLYESLFADLTALREYSNSHEHDMDTETPQFPVFTGRRPKLAS